jgi:hypothetical protein
MRLLKIALAAACATALLGSTVGVARADPWDHDHGWHGDHHGWRAERDWRWHHEHAWRPHTYAYVAPPPVYYSPPPVYYAPPGGVTFGVTIP